MEQGAETGQAFHACALGAGDKGHSSGKIRPHLRRWGIRARSRKDNERHARQVHIALATLILTGTRFRVALTRHELKVETTFWRADFSLHPCYGFLVLKHAL